MRVPKGMRRPYPEDNQVGPAFLGKIKDRPVDGTELSAKDQLWGWSAGPRAVSLKMRHGRNPARSPTGTKICRTPAFGGASAGVRGPSVSAGHLACRKTASATEPRAILRDPARACRRQSSQPSAPRPPAPVRARCRRLAEPWLRMRSR
jgi:hypothetical protein